MISKRTILASLAGALALITPAPNPTQEKETNSEEFIINLVGAPDTPSFQNVLKDHGLEPTPSEKVQNVLNKTSPLPPQ